MVAAALDAVGIDSYDVDSAGFPTNLEPVVLIESEVRRLSVWALGDSVWLDRDWRRPGETNVVAVTDHVGIVNNGRAIEATKGFFVGGTPEGDEASWREILKPVEDTGADASGCPARSPAHIWRFACTSRTSRQSSCPSTRSMTQCFVVTQAGRSCSGS